FRNLGHRTAEERFQPFLRNKYIHVLRPGKVFCPRPGYNGSGIPQSSVQIKNDTVHIGLSFLKYSMKDSIGENRKNQLSFSIIYGMIDSEVKHMNYKHTVRAQFLDRPNRFIAHVDIQGR